MRLVIVESPYQGDIARNVAYARRAMADCLARGEAPIASHLLYTQPGVLDDDVPEERRLGIDAGLAWGRVADAAVFYVDLGWSGGMHDAFERHQREGRTVEQRLIGEAGTLPDYGDPFDDCLGVHVEANAKRLFGMPVVVDPTMPPGAIELRTPTAHAQFRKRANDNPTDGEMLWGWG